MRKQVVAISPRDVRALEATVGTEVVENNDQYRLQQAIGVVDSVLNRAGSKTRDRGMRSPFGVVTSPQQYSDISRKKGEIGDIERPYKEGKITEKDRLANARAILSALSGNDSSLYGLPGATHYYNPDVANPAWDVYGALNTGVPPLTIGEGKQTHIMGYPYNPRERYFEDIDFVRPVAVASPQTYRDLYQVLADAGVDDFRDPQVAQRAQLTYNSQMARAAKILPDLSQPAYMQKGKVPEKKKTGWEGLGQTINEFFDKNFKEEVPRPNKPVPVPKGPLDGLTPVPVTPVTRAPLGPTTIPEDQGFSFQSVYDQPYDIAKPNWDTAVNRRANVFDFNGSDGVPSLQRFLYRGIPEGKFPSPLGPTAMESSAMEKAARAGVPTASRPKVSESAWTVGSSGMEQAKRAMELGPKSTTGPKFTVTNDGSNVIVTKPDGTVTTSPVQGAPAKAPTAPKSSLPAKPLSMPVSPTAPVTALAKLGTSGLGFLQGVGNGFLASALPTAQTLQAALTQWTPKQTVVAPKVVAPQVVAPKLPPPIAVPTLPVPAMAKPASANSMSLIGFSPSGQPLYSSGNSVNGVKQVFAGTPSNAFGAMGFGNMFSGFGSSGGSLKSDTTTKGATSKTGTGGLF